jgi:hypothetical protein
MGESNLQMGREKMALQKKQFGKQMDVERSAQDVAMGGMFLKGGLGAAKLGYDAGVFDDRINQLKGTFGGKQAVATGTQPTGPQPSYKTAPGNFQRAPQQQSSFGGFTGGEYKAGLWGGASGGLMGAGAAKALGAKKKWQTMAAGAAGGMFSTWMAGSSNPWSLALGGMLGGGIGAIF